MSKYSQEVNLLRDLKERACFMGGPHAGVQRLQGLANNGPGRAHSAWGRHRVENCGPSQWSSFPSVTDERSQKP